MAEINLGLSLGQLHSLGLQAGPGKGLALGKGQGQGQGNAGLGPEGQLGKGVMPGEKTGSENFQNPGMRGQLNQVLPRGLAADLPGEGANPQGDGGNPAPPTGLSLYGGTEQFFSGQGAGAGSGSVDLRSVTAAAIGTLTGTSDGTGLAPDTQQTLGQLADTVGHGPIQQFIDRGGQQAADLIGGAARVMDQTASMTATSRPSGLTGESVTSGQSSELNPGLNSTQSGLSFGVNTAQAVADQLNYTVQLDQRFAEAGSSVGTLAQQVEELVLSVLGSRWLASTRAGTSGQISGLSPFELLRDLRTSALLAYQENENPFLMADGLRESKEMVALLRTLEAILASGGSGSGQTESQELEALMAWLGIEREIAQLLLGPMPGFPGRVGRGQILSYLAAQNGMLAGLDGSPMLVREGAALKAGGLLWFGPLGNVISEWLAGSAYGARPSSFALYGFDAIFSLIPYDGRPLMVPYFLAVQSQINRSRQEWAFGEKPMSERWMRSLIERLKDAAVAEQNVLGETLEDALVEGRFFLGLIRGAVERGLPVPGSFSFQLAEHLTRGGQQYQPLAAV